MTVEASSYTSEYVSTPYSESLHSEVELPPLYTPSQPAPDYSSKPRDGELCVARSTTTRRRRRSSDSRGLLTYVKPKMKLTIKNCRKVDGIPTYGMGGCVQGELSLDERDTVLAVSVKLEGILGVTPNWAAGPLYTILFSDSYTLWQSESSDSEVCPGTVPFNVPFPLEIHDRIHDCMRPLPPSCSLPWGDTITSYKITVTVSFKSWKIPLMNRLAKVSWLGARLRYAPVVRPPRPMLLSSTPSTYQQYPDEWCHESWPLNLPSQSADELECHMYIPSVRVFVTSDPIPFHLHLKGSPSAIDSLILSSKSSSKKKGLSAYSLRVSLVRQTTITFKGLQSCGHHIIDEWKLELQPSATHLDGFTDPDIVTRDWTGELACGKESIKCTGFSTGDMSVKDYIKLSLVTKDSGPSVMYHAIPIRLVTSPCAYA